MKAILLLCLLVSISSFDILKVTKCVWKDEQVQLFFSYLKNHEYSKIKNLNFKDLVNMLFQCFNSENSEKDDDVVLKCMDYNECLHMCEEKHNNSKLCRAACVQWAC